MNYASIGLYGLLGVVLAICGINILDKPLEFICILLLVVAIDISTWVKYR